SAPGSPTTRASRLPSIRPPALALLTVRSVAPFHTLASSTALERNVIGSPGAESTRPGTDSDPAGCSAAGLVTVGNTAETAFGLTGMPAAANTAADPPNPCPTTPSFVGCTLIFPGPNRTPAMMSKVVPRSKARLSTDGATLFSVFGAAATMPHDARCSSVPSYRSAPANQS